MRNRRNPFYSDDTDYTTNSPSYYDDLARKQKLIEMLAKKIWEYDDRLNDRLDDLQKVLSSYLDQWDERIENLDKEVSHIFVTWLEDGTLEQIINHDVLGNKADKSFVDEQLAKTIQVANVKSFGAVGDGVADDTDAIKNAIQSVTQHGQVYFPAGVYRITDTLANNNVEGVPFAFDWIGESTGTFIYIDINDMEKNAIEITRVNHIKVRNLTLIGKDGCAKNGFYTHYMMRSEFENVTVLAGVDTMMETIHGYCNRINIKSPNSLTTGTHMSDVISGKWTHSRRGIYMSSAFATEFDVILEGLSGNGIESDNASGVNQSITIIGTIENLGGRGLDLKNITVLVIDNLYEEANRLQPNYYIGKPASVFEDCHFIDIVGHRSHYGSYKFLNCSNVDSGSPQFMQDVSENNGYSNDSPYSFNSSIEIESNTTAGIDPVRNTKSKPKFLNYPFFDRVGFSNRLVDTLQYSNGSIITDHELGTTGVVGTPVSRIIPQTNYNKLHLPLADVTGGLNGRMIFATIMLKKPDTGLIDPSFGFSFVTKSGRASEKLVYVKDLEKGWNRITMATKLSGQDLEQPSHLRITGYPTRTGDVTDLLPIEICYLAVTVDSPSTSPLDFDGEVLGGVYFENGTKITYDSKPPTQSTYHAVKGDRVLNKNANSDEYQGYICVGSSSPGAWKGYGLVEGDYEVAKVKKVETISLDSQTVVSGTTIDINTGVSALLTENVVVTFRNKTVPIPSGIVLSDWIATNSNVHIRIANIGESDRLIENVDVRILVLYS